MTKPSLIDLKAGARAQAAKNRADYKVATLAQQIAAEAKSVQQRSAAAALAEQRYVAQLSVDARARAAATTAAARVAQARADLERDEQSLAVSAAAAYESYSGPASTGVSTLGTLLIADDPSAVLATDTEHRMLVAHQVGVVEQVKLAIQTLRTAEQQQVGAEAAVARETARLASLRAEAEAALADAQHTITILTAALSRAKVSQKVADAALSSFLGGWSTADPKRADALNLAYAKLALQNKHRKPAPAAAHWTPAMGRTAVERALLYIGTNYAWAGGNSAGPTAGVCAPGDAHLDCHYVGFDCSGLALYAWAPYLSMAHYAATQYHSGSVHPAPDGLLPGDLVFWSTDGTAAGIHHVAIYVGDGNVIQAPQSGDIVRITPLGAVSSDYFGATRPMT
jgi:peptidoglycan DL-endopeptidase RipA